MNKRPRSDPNHFRFNLFEFLQQWLDQFEIYDCNIAHRTAKLIPAQCPFERNIIFFGRAIAHILHSVSSIHYTNN